jgi:hypothetical protein
VQTIQDGSEIQRDLEPARLGYREAKGSPCLTCPTSPCCSYLPLNKFKVTSLVELDHAVYLSGFDRVELGLAASGEWSAHYRHPCRFLAREDSRCTVHGTEDQPHICQRYNPYQCWYKRALTSDLDDEFLRIDDRRMDFILQNVVFGEDRQILEVPSWEALTEAFREIPLAADDWRIQSIDADVASEESATPADGSTAGKTSEPVSYGYRDETLTDPCAGCGAHCCGTLVFPQGLPATASNLDYFRFSLGFPGIELGISDETWTIALRTSCRHLRENRCSIYGQPERPLICSFYDEWGCTYRWQYGQARPDGFLRVALEDFEALSRAIRFDESGAVVEMPPVEVLAERLDGARREPS